MFKKWSRSDLLPNDRVFTSQYVYTIKRSARGEAYQFKTRMVVRGFEMEKGVDYVDNFSPTPGLAVARLMMSLAVANDMELHKIDIEQAFLQADKLDQGVNGWYFINSPPGSPEAGNKNMVYEVLRQIYAVESTVVHRHQELCTKPWTHILNLKGSTYLVSRSPCGYDLQAANTRRTSMCQLTLTTDC
jgi:hypothetical protein